MLLVALAIISHIQAVGAASSYANPDFESQWRQGEALTPNFWGPLDTAHDGQQEMYAEAAGGMRLVQYFDKGRMEAGQGGAVTNGLLASEIVKGQVQTGDVTFQPKAPPTIPIAGDPTNPGPTYAQLKAHADQFLVPMSSRVTTPTQGEAVTVLFNVTGEVVPFTEGMNYPAANISLYDDATQHNVPRAFASYRQRIGLGTVGLAISEPFWSNPKVGGKNLLVLVQAFERRVLTYTPTNDPAYQIEMGNIGQHYYQWRYGSASAPSAAMQQPSQTVAMNNVVADPAGTFHVTLPPGWRGPNVGSTSPNLLLVGPTAMRMINILDIRSNPTDLTILPNDPIALLRTRGGNVVIGNNATVTGASTVVIGEGATVTNPVDVTIGGEQGKQFTFTVQSSTTIYGKVYVALHNGRAYTFLGTVSDANYSDLDAIIGSLVFTDRFLS